MLKDDLVRIYKTVRDNWGLEHPDEQSVLKTWWRYLGDLELPAVWRAVDRAVINNQRWAPRPGELRRSAIDETEPDDIPTPAEAWATFIRLRYNTEHGLDGESRLHPTLTGTIRLLGDGARYLKADSGADREFFITTFNTVADEYCQERYGLGDEE